MGTGAKIAAAGSLGVVCGGKNPPTRLTRWADFSWSGAGMALTVNHFDTWKRIGVCLIVLAQLVFVQVYRLFQ